jgi:hypothetical protein
MVAVMTRSLHLTTPLMKGPDVSALQKALDVTADGEYGPATAAAVKSRKYAIGYLQRNVNEVADATFQQFLLHGVPKSRIDMALRAKSRAPKTTKRQKLLALAVAQIGVKESPPGSNRVLYSAWYGVVGPWCAMFQSWCAHSVGMAFKYAYVPYVVADARAAKNGLHVVAFADAIPGDFVCYDWDKDGVADHIGCLEKKLTATSFDAIEGNTSVGNESDGGEVMRRGRFTSDVLAFVRCVG